MQAADSVFPVHARSTSSSAPSGLAPARPAPLPSLELAGSTVVLDFRAVYKEHFAFVWRSLRRLGLAEHECQDGAQQVFLVVHRRLGEFRGDSKLTTWLFSICMHVVSNARRTHARRRETALDDAEGISRDGASSPHARTEARLTLEKLLADLPAEQRTAFLLYEIEELTCVEIAAVMGTSPGTVKSRLRLARERVASRLGVALPEAEKGGARE